MVRASPTRLIRRRTRKTPRGPQPRDRARQATRAWRIKMKSRKGEKKRVVRWFMPDSCGKPAPIRPRPQTCGGRVAGFQESESLPCRPSR